MTKIKTAQAWGAISDQGNLLPWAHHSDNCESGFVNRVVIVHGLTEAEVHEAAELLSACRELGIETVEQLKAKMQPDPRVAVLEKIFKWSDIFVADIGLYDQPELQAILSERAVNLIKLIAAQRGEVK